MTEATDTVITETKAKKARKAPAKKKAKKAAKKTKSASTGRRATYSDTAKIKILAKDGNPARANTNAHTMFAALKDGMTVGDYVKKAAAKDWDGRGNLRYWVNQGHIKISG